LTCKATSSCTRPGGFVPALGDTFPVLTCGSRVGTFDALDLPAAVVASYGASSVVLSAAPVVPVEISPVSLSAGRFVLAFRSRSNQTYTIQRSDDLATSNWILFTNFTGDGGLNQFFVPVTEAPHRFFRVREP